STGRGRGEEGAGGCARPPAISTRNRYFSTLPVSQPSRAISSRARWAVSTSSYPIAHKCADAVMFGPPLRGCPWCVQFTVLTIPGLTGWPGHTLCRLTGRRSPRRRGQIWPVDLADEHHHGPGRHLVRRRRDHRLGARLRAV